VSDPFVVIMNNKISLNHDRAEVTVGYQNDDMRSSPLGCVVPTVTEYMRSSPVGCVVLTVTEYTRSSPVGCVVLTVTEYTSHLVILTLKRIPSVLMYAMNIQNDVIGLVLRENRKSKQVTNFIA
jgi:hypothetical protein